MKYFYFIISIITVVLLGIIAFPHSSIKLGNSETSNYLSAPTVGTVTLSNGTSTQVLPANSGRLFANICSVPTNSTSTYLAISSAQNASGTTIGVQATANNGIYLAIGTCYKIDSSNLLIGKITAYANATSTLSLEYQ